ncbi:MAG: hypothetical protein HYX86_00495 [Chloroflexi bacterium]|nr:hypothetical protein [Chloroflexota bacterium]
MNDLKQAGGITTLISLADSLDSLREHFNRHQDKPRFLALLSPTCTECLDGAQAINMSIVSACPQAGISLSIVWINMLPKDSKSAAEIASQIIPDPRAAHFYDPHRRAGKAVAQVLGGNGKIAWDIYLFYTSGQEWHETPPYPAVWMHQLSKSHWADPARFRFGPDLIAALEEAVHTLLDTHPEFSSTQLEARWRGAQ